MSSTQHAEILIRKHETLERMLDRAYARHVPDHQILALKKRKLMIKDELARIATTGWMEERRRSYAGMY